MKLPLEHLVRYQNGTVRGANGVGLQTRTGAAQSVAQDFGYSWRSDGLLASRSTGSGASKLTETFGRDAHGRLTRAAVSGTGGRRLDYGYDALGSLLNRTSNVTADADATLSGHSASATAAPGPHAPRFATVGTERMGLAYDAAGRMTSRTVCAESSGATCTARSDADHRFVAWSARGLPTRVVVGAGLDDAAPTVREDFAHGPDGARHFRKTRWHFGGEGFRSTFWWEPVTYLSARVDGVRSRDDSQPGDEPLFTARDWNAIGVGTIPGVPDDWSTQGDALGNTAT